MALKKIDFPDGVTSQSVPSVTSVVSYKNELYVVTPTILIDGKIQLSTTPQIPDSMKVSWQGLEQYAPDDYTIASNEVIFSSTFLANLEIGHKILLTFQ